MKAMRIFRANVWASLDAMLDDAATLGLPARAPKDEDRDFVEDHEAREEAAMKAAAVRISERNRGKS